jgi:hypothetical protein
MSFGGFLAKFRFLTAFNVALLHPKPPKTKIYLKNSSKILLAFSSALSISSKSICKANKKRRF